MRYNIEKIMKSLAKKSRTLYDWPAMVWLWAIKSVLKKHLQEPTEEREVEIKREMEKLKSTLDKLKSMWLSITYNTYYSLVEELRENNIKTS